MTLDEFERCAFAQQTSANTQTWWSIRWGFVELGGWRNLFRVVLRRYRGDYPLTVATPTNDIRVVGGFRFAWLYVAFSITRRRRRRTTPPGACTLPEARLVRSLR